MELAAGAGGPGGLPAGHGAPRRPVGGSWAGHDLVYLFQRPESMPRALDKARSEMRRGAWLVSLEFEAAGWQLHSRLRCPDGRPLWLYRLPLVREARRSLK